MGKLAPSDIIQVRMVALEHSRNINETYNVEDKIRMVTPADKLIDDAKLIEAYMLADLDADEPKGPAN